MKQFIRILAGVFAFLCGAALYRAFGPIAVILFILALIGIERVIKAAGPSRPWSPDDVL